MAFFVYLLLCKDKSIYTGITTDLERRLSEHKGNTASRYTRARKAVKILYSERHPNRSKASRRESEIKSWPRAQKLALIRK